MPPRQMTGGGFRPSLNLTFIRKRTGAQATLRLWLRKAAPYTKRKVCPRQLSDSGHRTRRFSRSWLLTSATAGITLVR